MSDFKKQLSKWQQDKKVTEPEVPAVSKPKPRPAVPQAVTPAPEAVASDGELSKEDQLLFFEAVVGMGVSQQAKPEKLGLVEDEPDAEDRAGLPAMQSGDAVEVSEAVVVGSVRQFLGDG